MDIEILFLDCEGRFRCSLRAGFLSREAASRYAQSVMQTRFCRHYASAEIHAPDSLSPALVPRDADSRIVDLQGRIKRRAKIRAGRGVDLAGVAARPAAAR